VAVAVLAAEVAGLAVTVVVTDEAGVDEDEEQPAVTATRQVNAATATAARLALGERQCRVPGRFAAENTDVPFGWGASHTPFTQYDDAAGGLVGATPDHVSQATQNRRAGASAPARSE
jgi:hypothetical protein